MVCMAAADSFVLVVDQLNELLGALRVTAARFLLLQPPPPRASRAMCRIMVRSLSKRHHIFRRSTRKTRTAALHTIVFVLKQRTSSPRRRALWR